MHGLIHYWPISGDTKDLIGAAHMTNGVNASMTKDIFENPNSAINLNGGYFELPPGVYFNGSFTVTVLIKVSIKRESTLFDFGNGIGQDNVLLDFLSNTDNPCLYVYDSSTQYYVEANVELVTGKWEFLAFVVDGSTGYIYLNGEKVASGTIKAPSNIIRTNNYFGKSNWPTYLNAYADFDELKIYNRALNIQEITEEYLV